MISVILIAAVIYIVLKFIKRDVDDFSQVKKIQRKIHVFSGVHPELYMQYLTHINLAKEHIEDVDKSKKFLYKSIKCLEELALQGVSGDLDIHEEMTYLVQELGYTFEKLLLNAAINKGVRFRPIYLNEKI
jgi:hypothetical protein